MPILNGRLRPMAILLRMPRQHIGSLADLGPYVSYGIQRVGKGCSKPSPPAHGGRGQGEGVVPGNHPPLIWIPSQGSDLRTPDTVSTLPMMHIPSPYRLRRKLPETIDRHSSNRTAACFRISISSTFMPTFR